MESSAKGLMRLAKAYFKLLNNVLPKDMREECIGDLHEGHNRTLKRYKSEFRANLVTARRSILLLYAAVWMRLDDLKEKEPVEKNNSRFISVVRSSGLCSWPLVFTIGSFTLATGAIVASRSIESKPSSYVDIAISVPNSLESLVVLKRNDDDGLKYLLGRAFAGKRTSLSKTTIVHITTHGSFADYSEASHTDKSTIALTNSGNAGYVLEICKLAQLNHSVQVSPHILHPAKMWGFEASELRSQKPPTKRAVPEFLALTASPATAPRQDPSFRWNSVLGYGSLQDVWSNGYCDTGNSSEKSLGPLPSTWEEVRTISSDIPDLQQIVEASERP